MFLACLLFFLFSSAKAYSPRIVNGTEATEDEFPFQVAIICKGKLFSGAIIAPQIILTVAHGFPIKRGKEWIHIMRRDSVVIAGTRKIEKPMEKGAQRRNIREIKIHENFDLNRGLCDIALIKVTSPFDMRQSVTTIDMREMTVTDGIECTIAGWGLTNSEMQTKILPTLKKVDLKIINIRDCIAKWKGERREESFIGTVCADSDVGKTCKGDSGGPLVCDKLVTGLDSFGKKCGIYPGIYTNVAYYHDWIIKTRDELLKK